MTQIDDYPGSTKWQSRAEKKQNSLPGFCNLNTQYVLLPFSFQANDILQILVIQNHQYVYQGLSYHEKFLWLKHFENLLAGQIEATY